MTQFLRSLPPTRLYYSIALILFYEFLFPNSVFFFSLNMKRASDSSNESTAPKFKIRRNLPTKRVPPNETSTSQTPSTSGCTSRDVPTGAGATQSSPTPSTTRGTSSGKIGGKPTFSTEGTSRTVDSRTPTSSGEDGLPSTPQETPAGKKYYPYRLPTSIYIYITKFTFFINPYTNSSSYPSAQLFSSHGLSTNVLTPNGPSCF